MEIQKEIARRHHAGDRSSASNWPGGARDVLEYGRGQFSALALVSSDRAREVHIQRLRIAFDRAGIGKSLRYVLNVLSLMREVQELKGGYWIPTPPRLVPLAKSAILIAPIATEELRRHFEGVERAGYARLLPQAVDIDIDLPKQSLGDWAGFDGADVKAWTAYVARKAAKEMSLTIEAQSTEFFYLQRISRGPGLCTMPGWTPHVRQAVTPNGKTVLCRSRLGENYHRYFFGNLERGKIVAEAPTPNEVDRLQYGIAALAEQPITVQLDRHDDSYLFRTFSLLPRPERRLLLGLAVRRESRFGKTYQVRTEEHVQAITDALLNLGCDIKVTDA